MLDLYSRFETKTCNSINNVPLLFRKDSFFGHAKSLHLVGRVKLKRAPGTSHIYRLGRGLGKTLGSSIPIVKVVLPSRGCSKQSVLAFGRFGYFS